MDRVEVAAPAKINLALHVTGRRADGYHLLDGLVGFADVADTVKAWPGQGLSLTVGGPFAADVPTDERNLMIRAAKLMRVDNVRLHLEKNLPVASGIGGGSADAAATIRALASLFDLEMPKPEHVLGLGADVPACLAGYPLRMKGVGEEIEAITELPVLHAVLANPGRPVSTPVVFSRLSSPDNAGMEGLEDLGTDPIRTLGTLRNDLEIPAIAVAPVIGDVLSALRSAKNCCLARMSGSGATCFALFPDAGTASAAAREVSEIHPHWWVVDTVI